MSGSAAGKSVSERDAGVWTAVGFLKLFLNSELDV
jgi:hypothetical protein